MIIRSLRIIIFSCGENDGHSYLFVTLHALRTDMYNQIRGDTLFTILYAVVAAMAMIAG